MDSLQTAEREWQEVLVWAAAEEEKVNRQLEEKEGYTGGLDTNSEAYAYIREERNKRLKEIQEKYSNA